MSAPDRPRVQAVLCSQRRANDKTRGSTTVVGIDWSSWKWTYHLKRKRPIALGHDAGGGHRMRALVEKLSNLCCRHTNPAAMNSDGMVLTAR